jgi:hypothetical protein
VNTGGVGDEARPEVTRDGPWLVVQTTAGTLRILTGDPPSMTGFIDVEVSIADGRRFLGTVGTVADIAETMSRWKGTGECLGGRYFWISDLVVVASADVQALVDIVDDLASTGELASAFTLATED